MVSEDGIPSWERLQQLSKMSAYGRQIHAKQWADELMGRHRAGGVSGYIETAYRDTVAAVLLSLVEDQASVSHHNEERTGRLDGFASTHADGGLRSFREDASPAAIRTWAREKGIPINERGRIPMWVTDRYHAEHSDQGSEKSLSYKIRAALERHGELTKSGLWDVIGRSHSAEEIENALESLPSVQMFKGESGGGRPPVFFRLVEDPDEPAETAGGRMAAKDLGDTGSSPAFADASPGVDTTNSKIYDFLQLLRGETSDS